MLKENIPKTTKVDYKNNLTYWLSVVKRLGKIAIVKPSNQEVIYYIYRQDLIL